MHATRTSRHIASRHAASRAILIIAIALAMGACRTRLGGGDVGEVSSLARRVNDLEREVQLQTLRANEAEAKLAAAPQTSDQITRATPVLAGIEIDRLSGPTPSDATGFPIFVRTLDGRGRFIQVVGRLDIDVFVDDVAATSPIRVASATLGPLDVREAYRSSVTGTHYRVDLVADPQFLRSMTYRGGLARYDLRVVARFDDALTSQRHEATATLRARDRSPSAKAK